MPQHGQERRHGMERGEWLEIADAVNDAARASEKAEKVIQKIMEDKTGGDREALEQIKLPSHAYRELSLRAMARGLRPDV